MGHVVLLGDSIFDNQRYVPDRPCVVEQVRRSLPADWRSSLLAVDGDITEDVAKQLAGLPRDATHLFISVGGNDALSEVSILVEPARTVGDALGQVCDLRERFRRAYRAMLVAVSEANKPTTVCTVYDAIPGFQAAELSALAWFNEIILREAVVAGLPVIDLRLVCDCPSDFSHVSPIEPSMTGGAKIARLIAEIATTHDFSQKRSVIYA